MSKKTTGKLVRGERESAAKAAPVRTPRRAADARRDEGLVEFPLSPGSEKELVLGVRALLRDLGIDERRLALHLEVGTVLLKKLERQEEVPQGLAVALPHMVASLRRVLLAIEDGVVELEDSFSVESLARAILRKPWPPARLRPASSTPAPPPPRRTPAPPRRR